MSGDPYKDRFDGPSLRDFFSPDRAQRFADKFRELNEQKIAEQVFGITPPKDPPPEDVQYDIRDGFEQAVKRFRDATGAYPTRVRVGKGSPAHKNLKEQFPHAREDTPDDCPAGCVELVFDMSDVKAKPE